MARNAPRPDRVHLIAHAGSALKDLRRFGFCDAAELIGFARQHLPPPLRLTSSAKFFHVCDDEERGGRFDDAARVRDLQAALNDPRTLAIVAANGGAYFSRILPDVDFSVLARRRQPLWALGFSEMTTLVNIVASYRCGRGLYWLCPNYLGWKIKTARRQDHDDARPSGSIRHTTGKLKPALAAYAEFWRLLPMVLGVSPKSAAVVSNEYLDLGPVKGRLVYGRAATGPVRLVGGCISVLAAILTGKLGRRIKPDGCWLAIEDINEAAYRIDRQLASLKHAGWFERLAGVLVGDFHTKDVDQQQQVVDILRFHTPRDRKLPIITTHSFGHTWPMVPLPINQPLRMTVRGKQVQIEGKKGSG